MALKDWKKVGRYRTDWEWKKNKKTLEIFPSHDIHIVRIALNNRNIQKPREFKTKLKALAYAKSYMRKH